MSINACNHCGASLDSNEGFCKYCGSKNEQIKEEVIYQQPIQQQYAQQPNVVYQQVVRPRVPLKSKITAGVLGILIGGFGIHKFYLGKIGQGILYILFSWTYIPVILGFIEGITYLVQSEDKWCAKVGYKI